VTSAGDPGLAGGLKSHECCQFEIMVIWFQSIFMLKCYFKLDLLGIRFKLVFINIPKICKAINDRKYKLILSNSLYFFNVIEYKYNMTNKIINIPKMCKVINDRKTNLILHRKLILFPKI